MSNCKRCKSRRTLETGHWYTSARTPEGQDLRWSNWWCWECEWEWTIFERRGIIGYDA